MFQTTISFFEYLPLLIQENNGEDAEFNLFLFSMLISGILFICISLIVAVLLVIITLLAVFGFITVGALSASVLVGLSKKSVTTGFRTFVILFVTFAMTIIGALSFWILNRIVHWWSQIKSIFLGSCVGLISGLIIGIVAAYVIKKLSTFLKSRINRKNVSIS